MAQDQHFPVQVKSPQAAGLLLFERLVCSERIGEPFTFELSVLSERSDLGADDLLGKPVTVMLELPGGSPRPFNGLVTRMVRTGVQVASRNTANTHLHRYQLRLQPWLWFLTRTADCRIFQSKSVKDIFEAIVKDHGFTDYRFALTGSYASLEYCVQYRETDFNFVSRLLEQAGISYYFEHQDGKHTMVLADDAGAYKTVSPYDEVRFSEPSSERALIDSIESWWVENKVQPGAYASTDYNFETPSTSLLDSATQKRGHSHSDLEIFDFPVYPQAGTRGDVTQDAKVRLQEMQAGFERFHGSTQQCGGLRTGAKFKLKEHPDKGLNRDYMIIATEHTLTSNQYVSGGEERHDLTVAIEAIDAKTVFRPLRVTPKPVIQGAQTAVVVGKSGEEIDVDKYGRVKVHFPWDRHGTQDENSSCWVRVVQVWAGQNWGAMHIPRIGQEVLVSFLEGDPDRPVITGRVYNAEQMPPYALPANATQSGIKSRSSKGGGSDNFNEIRFEDKKGSEMFSVQAEKDFQGLVKNDETTEVKHDRTDKVGHDETRTIENDQSTTIKGQETRKVTKDRTTNVDQNEKLKVGQDQKIDVGQNFELSAGTQITLKTGASSITMKQDGTIEIKGMTITVSGTQSVTVKGNVGVTLQVSSTKVALDPASLNLQATMLAAKGQAQTQVQGAIVQISGQGMTQVSGGIIMIG